MSQAVVLLLASSEDLAAIFERLPKCWLQGADVSRFLQGDNLVLKVAEEKTVEIGRLVDEELRELWEFTKNAGIPYHQPHGIVLFYRWSGTLQQVLGRLVNDSQVWLIDEFNKPRLIRPADFEG